MSTVQHNRSRVLIGLAIFGGALVVAAAVAGALLIFSLVFPTPGAHCFDHVKSVASELKLETAGKVLSTRVADDGGYNDCGNPRDVVVLQGSAPYDAVAASLGRVGFTQGSDQLTWDRSTDKAQVLLAREQGNTTVAIAAK